MHGGAGVDDLGEAKTRGPFKEPVPDALPVKAAIDVMHQRIIVADTVKQHHGIAFELGIGVNENDLATAMLQGGLCRKQFHGVAVCSAKRPCVQMLGGDLAGLERKNVRRHLLVAKQQEFGLR